MARRKGLRMKQEIERLRGMGHGKKTISRILKVSRNTVRRYWEEEKPEMAPPFYVAPWAESGLEDGVGGDFAWRVAYGLLGIVSRRVGRWAHFESNSLHHVLARVPVRSDVLKRRVVPEKNGVGHEKVRDPLLHFLIESRLDCEHSSHLGNKDEG